MDKTYSELCGKPAFDWNKALDSAIQYEPDEESAKLLFNRASEWSLCACGNQCAIIPRFGNESQKWPNCTGAPKDKTIRDLGLCFMDEIEDRLWGTAKSTLGKIEARSTILIAEELAKLNATDNAPLRTVEQDADGMNARSDSFP